MIRTAWGFLVAFLATLYFGSIVFVAGLLGRGQRIFYWCGQRWSQTLLWAAGSEVQAHGLDRVDWTRPKVIVCNHISAFDVLALAVSIPVPFRFVAKRELERVPLFGPAWKRAGHISIDRQNRESAIESLRRGADMVRREGGVIIIFPEGTRSTTGELQPFKKGAFVLAAEAGFPIVPAVVVGSERIMPKGKIRFQPAVMELHFGEAIPVEPYTAETADQLMQETYTKMRAMLAAVRGS